MALQILTTKLYIPATQSELIPRTTLIDRLNRGLKSRLTLISAPAGFGKTTTVCEWSASCAYPVAWLSLDEQDNDLTRFFAYLIAALRTITPHIGEDLLVNLRSAHPPAIDILLTALVNEIATMPDDFLLILDDYHVLDNPEIDDALAFLLDHLPPQMHIVMTTREDPSLPLARLRARGHLVELRATDLRFTLEETAEFLNHSMGLQLPPDDIAILEARTEGWVAGLQLAGLSMQGRTDVHSFIEKFAGDHRFVVDYLVEEVLQRQPEHIRKFLLQTSILQRLNPALCSAVTGQAENATLLEELERSNLFVIHLDDERQWYRYHHLFADVLRTHLKKEQHAQLTALHRRASAWYAQNGWQREAIHHALIIEDYDHVANLIELNWHEMDANYASAAWISQVQRLPESTVLYHPVLCAGYGWTLLYRSEFEAAERWFEQAEYWLNNADCEAMRVADSFQFEMLPASLNSARAYQAMARGDLAATLHHAQQALKLVGDAKHASRTQAMAIYGMAQLANGDLSDADTTISTLIDYMQQAGRIADALELMFIVGDIRITCGKLHSAYVLYQRGFDMLESAHGANLIGMEDLYRGVVDVYLEWGDLHAAEHHLNIAEESGRRAVSRPDWHHRLNLTAARLAFFQGDFKRALELLDIAQGHYAPSPIPQLRSAGALRARVWIKQGNLSLAASWANENIPDEITYLTEFDHITHARLLMAQGETHDALTLLKRLQQAAEIGGRIGCVIEILVLQALTHQAQGDMDKAVLHVHQALNLAEPEGYIRVFTAEGQSMRNLLSQCLTEGIHVAYVMRLIRSTNHPEDDSENFPYANELLIEPLSDRELEVLGCLSKGLSNQAIADELFIALSTVKKHVNNIMGKLGVSNRTQAVNRARDLGLL